MNINSLKLSPLRNCIESIFIPCRPRNVSLSLPPKLALCVCAILGLALTSGAQTPICGNITTVTWALTGNPYIIACDSTVPSGQTLTIQPGVIVWLGSNVTLTVNGSIQAVGIPGANPANRIIFQAPVPSQHWNSVQLNHSGAINRFKYCDFQNANLALSLKVAAVNDTMYNEIMNCNFNNCTNAAIYGESEGYYTGFFGGYRPLEPNLNPTIKNCTFNNCGDGCRFYLYGHSQQTGGGGTVTGRGSASPRIIGNIFTGLVGKAFNMTAGAYPKSSTPIFINNTIMNSQGGVESQEPWDVRIQDNIFVGVTNAVKKSGSLSLTTSYNDFYGNATNFTGYPPNYGQWIIPNRNGTLADLSFNISQDPQFVGAGDFHLANGSPCIDAGTPDTAFCDLCMSNAPSQGAQFPDLGAYGGPDACNWLDIVPKLSVRASMSKLNNVIFLNWAAIPRSEYQVQYVTNLALVGTNNWLNFPSGRVIATEKPTSLPVSTGTTQSNAFFRIQSLGRPTGN